jgi:hypothetical protein
MCGGNADPTVYYANTQATQAYFLANGLPAQALTVVDVDSAPSGATDPFAAAKLGFAQFKANTAAAAGSNATLQTAAVAAAYHGTLVPPFCNVVARGFFQTVLAQ